MICEIGIRNGSNIHFPSVEEGITWEVERKGVPGKLSFSVIKNDSIDFQEGNAVYLKVDGVGLFYGFVFTKKRRKDGIISVTAYDQLRYLKNKDTRLCENETASQLTKQIADDFKLNIGNLDDSKFVIEKRIEDNVTLFDMIQTALDITNQNTGEMYVLYDDYGKICLNNVGNMKLQYGIGVETAEDFDYTSSIDSNTYNQVKLEHDNDKTKKREVYIVYDSNNINNWGVLQYFEKINEKVNGPAKAEALLSFYNNKTRNLTISGAIGDLKVRAGCLIPVNLNLGDIDFKNYMLVEKVKHTFENNNHTMDLTLAGGGFVG